MLDHNFYSCIWFLIFFFFFRFTYLEAPIHTHAVGDVKWCEWNHFWLLRLFFGEKSYLVTKLFGEEEAFSANWNAYKKLHQSQNPFGSKRLSKTLGQQPRRHHTFPPKAIYWSYLFWWYWPDQTSLTGSTDHPSLDCYLAIWPFQPKKDHKTFSYPWAKVEILEYEMQHKLIFESLKSQKNLVRLSSLTETGISKEPWWLHPPPTFYRFVIPSLIWYLSYWCLIRSHRSSHSRWDLKYDWTSSVNQTTFLNRNLILLILSNVEKCCLQNPTMSNNIV